MNYYQDQSKAYLPPPQYQVPFQAQAPIQPQVVYNVDRPAEPACCCGITAKVCLVGLFALSSLGSIMALSDGFDDPNRSSLSNAYLSFCFLCLLVTAPACYFIFTENPKGIKFSLLGYASLTFLQTILYVSDYAEKSRDQHYLVKKAMKSATLAMIIISVVFTIVVCERGYKLMRHIELNHKFNAVTGTNGLVA